jgi:transcription-repair coupling factor (superfamily II helicase)
MSQIYFKHAQPHTGLKTTWGSLHGSSDALSLVEFTEQEDKVVLLIASDIVHFNALYQSLSFYNNTLEVLKFDNWEVLAYDYFSPHPGITSNRLSTLSKLKNLKKGIVITTLESLFFQLCPLDFVEKYSFNIKVGDKLEIVSFSERLIKIGYNRVTTVRERGEFNIRGSLIDVYPMGSKTPFRLDLFDLEVESIRIFDPSTQRSETQIERILLLPAREFATDPISLELFKTNYQNHFSTQTGFIIDEVNHGRLPGGIEFYLPLFFNQTHTLFDYLPAETVLAYEQGFANRVVSEFDNINLRFEQAKNNLERAPLAVSRVFLSKEKLFSLVKSHSQLVLGSSKLPEKSGNVNFFAKTLPPIKIEAQTPNPLLKFSLFAKNFTGKILIVCASKGRQNVLAELLKNHYQTAIEVSNWQEFLTSKQKLSIVNGVLSVGFLTDNIAVITEHHLFSQEAVAQQRRRRAKHKDFDEAIKSLVEIQINHPIVHEHYGIGRYLGLKTQVFDGQAQDFLQLEYAGGSKLMVPIAALNLISRYSGVSPENAPLHKLGTPQWNKAKQKAGEAMFDTASELLEIYAKRQAQKGFAFDEPSDAYNAFVVDFPFEETPDQLKTMSEVLLDMCSDKPMDRLVCGDVGFGKTEIAMRAAFLAVENQKQVAILVPTTLLANQHYQSFVDRFLNYPVEVAALSRFQTPKAQKIIKEKLATGNIDIVVGTHKIIQGTVKYKNLGLVIIDEEHRFGVKQKEALKKIRGQSDILTMTATPIPRTLNMALGSLRELSIIATPPQGRSAIKTFVQEWKDNNIREACSRELHRGGQIFVLHNDIDSIDNMAEKLSEIMPNSSVRIAHGQMPTRELERIMNDFYHQRFQVLVCTTIIETGIDIPSANTIIINNAQNFGLAQLHQLRGRVGRSNHRAYAYLIVKSFQSLSKDAKKRLDAIESLEALGSGFMLASHDLEIRGAGDLLGGSQSGKISDIGFNLYHDLLKRTVDALRAGRKINLESPVQVEISTGIACIIPQTYLDDVHERLVLYKRIASCKHTEALKDLQIEMMDRFGLLPDAIKNLFASTQLKLFCEKIGVNKVSLYEDKVIIDFSDDTQIEPMTIINLIQKQSRKFKLKGQSQLIWTTELPNDITRIERAETMLKTLI